MNLSAEHLRTLRHMLGIDDPWMRSPTPTRDYYCANHADQEMHDLMWRGAVRMYRKSENYEWFTTTDSGRAAAIASHKAIRKPRSARVYRKFLNVRDALPDLTFRQFLTDPMFRDCRHRS